MGMSEEEGDAAALRRAFNAAAETFPGSVTAYLNRTPTGRGEAEKLMAWWTRFYEAIRDHEAGLALLGELRRAKETIAARAAHGTVADAPSTTT
jgi:hypothetical protein